MFFVTVLYSGPAVLLLCILLQYWMLILNVTIRSDACDRLFSAAG